MCSFFLSDLFLLLLHFPSLNSETSYLNKETDDFNETIVFRRLLLF